MNSTERQLQEVGDKAPADLRTTVEGHISNLRTALNSNDTSTEELQRLTGELEQATYQLSELLYKQATGSEGGPAGAEGAEYAPEDTHHPDDDTVDTEFKA
jgi:molecular chaperone DnaK